MIFLFVSQCIIEGLFFVGEKQVLLAIIKEKSLKKPHDGGVFFGVISGLFECWGENSVFFAAGIKLKTCKGSAEKSVFLLFRSGISVRHRGIVLFFAWAHRKRCVSDKCGVRIGPLNSCLFALYFVFCAVLRVAFFYYAGRKKCVSAEKAVSY